MSSPIMALQQVGTQQVGYWMTYPTGTSTCGEDDASKAVRVEGGEISASGDDAPAKVRKPYTITKQRERWTEDEHQKFLEALKLYGRAWRRIEEHIGSKTAVQIRSHAQKFFSKLERKASVGSLPVTGGSQDIEIPPPRPKRKPSHPYPRKAGGAFSISSSFEEDSKSPRAVCSGFTSLESPTLNMWKAPLKNMSQTTFPTLSRQLSLQPFSVQEVSHEAQQKAGSSSSLRLFGQTVVVPGSDSCALDTEHQIDPSDSICLDSESTGSPRSEVSMEVDEDSGILSSRCSAKEAGPQEKSACICQPHGAVGASSDNGSCEALVCDTNEKFQTCENNLELSKEIHEAAQKGQKLNLDLSCRVDRSNDSTISNLTSSSSIPPKSPLLSSPHRLSVHQHASQSCEGVSPLTLSNISGSCFTPWHPSREVAKQHPGLFSASATGFLPSLPPEHFFQRSNEDASSAAAVAAASFAVASAWQVIQGAIPAAIGHPNMGMVYSPVAILAASTEPAFGPATHFFGSFSPLEQPTNTNLTCKRERGKVGDIHKHSAGNEVENGLTEMQVEDDNFAVVSTDEGYCSPPDTCAISCESSCDHIDGAPWEKRNRMSYGNKMNTWTEATEACKSLARTHSATCDPLMSESERRENVNVILFSETDTEVVQHGCNDNVIVHNSNSSIEASSVNSRKSEECDDKKQETGCAQMIQSSRQIEASLVQGLQLSEVYDLQNVPIEKDENTEKQKALHDAATLVWEGVCPSGTGKQSLLSADDEGGIQLKDEQQCSALIEESESLPSGSKLGTEKREITSSEQGGKNISLTNEVNNENGATVHIGAYGGDTETEMCIGKHQFVKMGKLTSASRYSGVGFVPYKRASGEVKVPRNTVS